MISGSKQSSAVVVVELTKEGETVKICKGKEVEREREREIMTNKKILYENITMKISYISQIWYFVKKWSQWYMKWKYIEHVDIWLQNKKFPGNALSTWIKKTYIIKIKKKIFQVLLA